jgi:hypothetical protein
MYIYMYIFIYTHTHNTCTYTNTYMYKIYCMREVAVLVLVEGKSFSSLV